ncbi:hypothetical protein QYE76_008265 [Lolium multiflorum]|uniref:Transposase (putative) gypsy type domain-containing protein n=1 Tax=Lolium multiflorum TaxID=4521 RepID=A0AAD8PJ30_LOLMU|nr:hypothetical protein QYE76_008265 [Lolium multiflorum]
MTKAWVERGLSLPCSEFFLSILNTYGLQPHNICPNSYLLLSNFATLCEGHLGIRPDVKLWQFFFRVKKETKDKAMLNCGSMTFMLRPGRMYPPHDSHESVRYWNAGWFYEKNLATLAEENLRTILRVPVSGDTAEEVPDDEEEEEEQAPRKAAPDLRRPPAVSSWASSRAGQASASPSTIKPSIDLQQLRLPLPLGPPAKSPSQNMDWKETKRGHTFLTRYRSGGTPLQFASARDQEALRAVALRDWGQPQP